MSASSSGSARRSRIEPRELLLDLVSLLDRVVPKGKGIVLRTGPDYSDQGRELVRAMAGAGARDVVWLVNDVRDIEGRGLPCRFVRANSARGLWSYWRAKVVAHTHGVFGSRRGGRGKRFVNLWHGMPIKRLEEGSDMARFQTTCSIATAPVHQRNLARTWGVPEERIILTGLPRNDVLVRRRGEPPPPELLSRTRGRPLVAWLPTFRSTIVGTERADGRDLGTATQFEGADLESVNERLAELGAYCLIKPHPLAPVPERASMSNLDVLSTDELHASGLTLYELLAHTDCLITDHSSVWIDFLLTGRPILFALSDRDVHEAGRGFYFPDLEALFPGPLATDWSGLSPLLATALAGGDPWATRRSEALSVHHVHTDGGAAERVSELVIAVRDGWVPGSGDVEREPRMVRSPGS